LNRFNILSEHCFKVGNNDIHAALRWKKCSYSYSGWDRPLINKFSIKSNQFNTNKGFNFNKHSICMLEFFFHLVKKIFISIICRLFRY